MTFFRADEPDDELDDELEDLSDSEAPLFISIHHHIPMVFGTLSRDGLMLPDLPPIAPERARKPASPGMSPIWLPAPFDPDSLRLLAPPGATSARGDAPASRLRLGAVARSPFATQQAQPSASPPQVAVPAAGLAAPQAAPEIEATIRRSWGEQIDPQVAFLFYLALGLGIAWSGVDTLIRLSALWTVLLLIGLALLMVDAPPRLGTVSISDVVWGLAIGLIVGLPTLIVMNASLVEISGALFPEMFADTPLGPALVLLFQMWVILAPLAETVFFRGTIQKSREVRDMVSSIVSAGANNILFFLPIALKHSSFQAALPIFYLTLLAGVYSFVRRQYGFTAALICQIAVNVMLLFIPGIYATIFATRTP